MYIAEKMKMLYQFNETVFGMIPAGGVNFRYTGEAEIHFLDSNEEEIGRIDIRSVTVTVNGKNDPFASLPDESIAPEFYEKAREAARQRWMERRLEWQ